MHPLGGLHLPITPVPGDLAPLLASAGTSIHAVQLEMWWQNSNTGKMEIRKSFQHFLSYV